MFMENHNQQNMKNTPNSNQQNTQNNPENIPVQMMPNQNCQQEEEKPKKSMQREILEWVLCIVAAFLVATLITTYLFRVVRVDGQSMEPTIQHGDMIVVRKIMYTPKAGDVVVLVPPTQPMDSDVFYIKRIIATEGQTVEVTEDGKVKVDGKIIDEPYLKANEFTNRELHTQTPVTVGKGHVFVFGDNRQHSSDSGEFGTVEVERIIGCASLRFWPFSSFGTVD